MVLFEDKIMIHFCFYIAKSSFKSFVAVYIKVVPYLFNQVDKHFFQSDMYKNYFITHDKLDFWEPSSKLPVYDDMVLILIKFQLKKMRLPQIRLSFHCSQ